MKDLIKELKDLVESDERSVERSARELDKVTDKLRKLGQGLERSFQSLDTRGHKALSDKVVEGIETAIELAQKLVSELMDLGDSSDDLRRRVLKIIQELSSALSNLAVDEYAFQFVKVPAFDSRERLLERKSVV